jgi:hypothetical protein
MNVEGTKPVHHHPVPSEHSQVLSPAFGDHALLNFIILSPNWRSTPPAVPIFIATFQLISKPNWRHIATNFFTAPNLKLLLARAGALPPIGPGF